MLYFYETGVFMYGVTSRGRVLSDYLILSNVVATILVVAVTIQVCARTFYHFARYVVGILMAYFLLFQVMIDTTYWTMFNHIVIWGSLVVYFVTTWMYNKLIGGEYTGALTNVIHNYLPTTIIILFRCKLNYLWWFLTVFLTVLT